MPDAHIDTSSVLAFLGLSSLLGEDVRLTPATGFGAFAAAFPGGLDGVFTARAAGAALETAGFGGGDGAGCVAVCGMLSLAVPPELSLEFTCGTETSVACVLVTDAAVTAGAGLLLP